MARKTGLPTVVTMAAALGAAALVAPAAAQDVDFRGKTLNVLISTRAGGGTDAQARLIGRHLPKYLPGTPQATYSNMPGAAGVKAINHFTQRTKPDGTTLLVASGESVEPGTLQNPATRYDPRELRIVGGTTSGGTVLLMRQDAAPRLTDKTARPVVVGAPDPTRTVVTMTLLGAEYLGWNMKWVIGYGGTPGLMLAVQQGETDVFGTSTLFHLNQLKQTGKFAGLAQDGDFADGKFAPRKAFPEVPVLSDLLAGKLSGVALDAYETWVYSNQVGKWLALAPGTPDAVFKLYETAFARLFQDAEFVAEAKKSFGEDFEGMAGRDLQAIVARLYATSPEALDFLAGLRAKYGLPRS